MRRRQSPLQPLVYEEFVEDGHATPLFRPVAPIQVAQRSVGRAVAVAIAVTLLVVGVCGVFAFAYQAKTAELRDVQRERDAVAADRADIRTELAITQSELVDTSGRLVRANSKLTATTKSLTRAKRNLTKLQRDLAGANERADANFSAGYSAGTSAGYSSGREAGLVQGSDELACSDDPDVYWLPACNW